MRCSSKAVPHSSAPRVIANVSPLPRQVIAGTAFGFADVRSWALPGLACAALYFAMSYPLARLAGRLEARLFESESLELQGAPA